MKLDQLLTEARADYKQIGQQFVTNLLTWFEENNNDEVQVDVANFSQAGELKHCVITIVDDEGPDDENVVMKVKTWLDRQSNLWAEVEFTDPGFAPVTDIAKNIEHNYQQPKPLVFNQDDFTYDHILLYRKPAEAFNANTYDPRERFMNTPGERAKQARVGRSAYSDTFGGDSSNYTR
jgi:hypothetical protein